jgi:hypothetical protein
MMRPYLQVPASARRPKPKRPDEKVVVAVLARSYPLADIR